MKKLIKHVKDNIYVDGHGNYWINHDNNKFYGYNYISGATLEYICKPDTDFKVFDYNTVSTRNQAPKMEAKPVVTNPAADLIECGS